MVKSKSFLLKQSVKSNWNLNSSDWFLDFFLSLAKPMESILGVSVGKIRNKCTNQENFKEL